MMVPAAILLPICADRFSRRTDEQQAGVGAALGELGVLGEEAVARMDRVGADPPRGREDRSISRYDSSWARAPIRTASSASLHAARAHRHRSTPRRSRRHAPQRAEDPPRDLATIATRVLRIWRCSINEPSSRSARARRIRRASLTVARYPLFANGKRTTDKGQRTVRSATSSTSTSGTRRSARRLRSRWMCTADNAMPSTVRVSRGSMMPSSHRRAVAKKSDRLSVSICSSTICRIAASAVLVERLPGTLGGLARARSTARRRVAWGPITAMRWFGHVNTKRGSYARPTCRSCRRRSYAPTMTVRCGTVEFETALIILAPSLMMPPLLVAAADHEAGDVLQEDERRVGLVAELDELRALLRRFGEEDAVVGEDADRVAVDVRLAADQGRAVGRLELVEARAVDDAGDDLASRRTACGCRSTRGPAALRVVERLLDRHALRPGPSLRQLRCATISRPMRIASRSSSREVVGDARDAACISAPPSSSSSMSSPIAIFTSGGPPRNTLRRSSP